MKKTEAPKDQNERELLEKIREAEANAPGLIEKIPTWQPFLESMFRLLEEQQPEKAKKMKLETTPMKGQKFILDQLNRFEWAIAAVQAQSTPQDMERVVRSIFRTAWIVFTLDFKNHSAEADPRQDMEEQAASQLWIHTLIEALSRVYWPLFFDRVKGTKRLYTMPEACEILGLVRQTIVKYIQRGELQAMKAPGGWRIPIESIENYFEKLWEKGKK